MMTAEMLWYKPGVREFLVSGPSPSLAASLPLKQGVAVMQLPC